MHAYDRTLLAKLGFADQDKQDPRHDLGCQYLTSPDVLSRLVEHVAHPMIGSAMISCDLTTISMEQYHELVESCPGLGPGVRKLFRGHRKTTIGGIGNPVLEYPLSKGQGQYKTTIGFLDALIPYSIREERDGEAGSPRSEYAASNTGSGYRYWIEWSRSGNPPIQERRIAVEVKVCPVGLGEILRQINLYKEFVCVPASRFAPASDPIDWVLATLFPLSDSEIAILKDREKIHHVRLGSTFEKWCEWQRRPDGNTTTESKGSIVL